MSFLSRLANLARGQVLAWQRELRAPFTPLRTAEDDRRPPRRKAAEDDDDRVAVHTPPEGDDAVAEPAEVARPPVTPRKRRL